MAYIDGSEARETGWWERAGERFFEATQFDGSEAIDQEALVRELLRAGPLPEAETVRSAAVLLDPDNETYRRELRDILSRRR